jgi:hypothetical protein
VTAKDGRRVVVVTDSRSIALGLAAKHLATKRSDLSAALVAQVSLTDLGSSALLR